MRDEMTRQLDTPQHHSAPGRRISQLDDEPGAALSPAQLQAHLGTSGEYLIVTVVTLVVLILAVALFRGDRMTTTLQFARVWSGAMPSRGSR